jgi:hypothetical protein
VTCRTSEVNRKHIHRVVPSTGLSGRPAVAVDASGDGEESIQQAAAARARIVVGDPVAGGSRLHIDKKEFGKIAGATWRGGRSAAARGLLAFAESSGDPLALFSGV